METLNIHAAAAPADALPRWMRLAMWATTPLNMLGAFIFLPANGWARRLGGLPEAGHPMYLWIIAAFIGIFGVGYGYCAAKGRASREFVGVGAAGKIAFFVVVAAFWLSGEVPFLTTFLAGADLLLGALFAWWLLRGQAPQGNATGSHQLVHD